MCAVDLPTPELRGKVVRRCFARLERAIATVAG
jgi:hypothetical protein